VEKNVSVFAPERALRMPAIFGFSCGGFVEKSIQWAGVFIWSKPAPAKAGKDKNLWQSPQANRVIYFYPKQNKPSRPP